MKSIITYTRIAHCIGYYFWYISKRRVKRTILFVEQAIPAQRTGKLSCKTSTSYECCDKNKYDIKKLIKCRAYYFNINNAKCTLCNLYGIIWRNSAPHWRFNWIMKMVVEWVWGQGLIVEMVGGWPPAPPGQDAQSTNKISQTPSFELYFCQVPL